MCTTKSVLGYIFIIVSLKFPRSEPINLIRNLLNSFINGSIFLKISLIHKMSFPGSSDSKASAYNAGDPGSIHGSGRSPREGNGNPFQYSCLENPMEGGTS